MTDYKLVQLEPTPEMVEAAEEAYMPFGDMALAIRMAVLMAPDVQGEPVALPPFASKIIEKLHRFNECAEDGQGVDIGRHWLDTLVQLGLLNRVRRSPALWEMAQQGEDVLEGYTAPQPAEQQPTCPTCRGRGWDMDCQSKFRPATCPDCAGSGKFEHSITVHESNVAALDVAALVEALEWLRGAVNCTPSPNDKYQSGTWISTRHPRIKQIDTILAAHRKQGGEV